MTKINQWTREKINEQINEGGSGPSDEWWSNERTDVQTKDERMHAHTNEWMSGLAKGWMSECVDEWVSVHARMRMKPRTWNLCMSRTCMFTRFLSSSVRRRFSASRFTTWNDVIKRSTTPEMTSSTCHRHLKWRHQHVIDTWNDVTQGRLVNNHEMMSSDMTRLLQLEWRHQHVINICYEFPQAWQVIDIWRDLTPAWHVNYNWNDITGHDKSLTSEMTSHKLGTSLTSDAGSCTRDMPLTPPLSWQRPLHMEIPKRIDLCRFYG